MLMNFRNQTQSIKIALVCVHSSPSESVCPPVCHLGIECIGIEVNFLC